MYRFVGLLPCKKRHETRNLVRRLRIDAVDSWYVVFHLLFSCTIGQLKEKFGVSKFSKEVFHLSI
jgi:hypothetical protein